MLALQGGSQEKGKVVLKGISEEARRKADLPCQSGRLAKS
jgi:hypothetical protein